MVQIRPFQGLRYNAEKTGGYTPVTAPPYDVISPSEQEQLHEKSPYNIVRLILGKKFAADNDTQNVYSRAHQILEEWRTQGVLLEETQPAIYAYSQTWEGMERRGFIAGLQIESYESGQVLPHEFTLGGPKADRLALFKATGSILSPIFCLYNDPQKQIEAALFATSPQISAIEVTDKDGVLHRFWPITEPRLLELIQGVLREQAVLIADGHHRYETAMAYRDWRRSADHQENAPIGSLPWDFTMAFFTNMADKGLKVYPTHRVFTSLPEGWSHSKLIESMSAYFEPTTEDKALFWIQVSGGNKQAYQLKPGVDLSAIPGPLQTLDVALLDQFAFQGILQKPANELKQEGFLQFIRDEDEIADLLKEQNVLVLWVHAPDVEQVRQICQSGLRMPQKSTYFYPKLLSGLVVYYYGVEALAGAQRFAKAQGATHS